MNVGFLKFVYCSPSCFPFCYATALRHNRTKNVGPKKLRSRGHNFILPACNFELYAIIH